MRNLNHKFFCLGLLIFLFGSCGGGSSTKAPLQDPKKESEDARWPPKVLATLESIQRDLVNESCLGCHSVASDTNHHVDLSNVSKLLDGASHDSGSSEHKTTILVPGCPQQSLFLSIMKEGKMPPPPASKIAGEALQAVETWIESLNQNADLDCDSDEPRSQDQPDDDEPGDD